MEQYLGPLGVTLSYIVLCYLSMFRVTKTKIRLKTEAKSRGEKFDRYFTENREMLAADRIYANMLEQLPGFLILMWSYCLFVNKIEGVFLGFAFVFLRLAYPYTVGRKLGRDIKVSVLFTTLPGYLILIYYFISLLAVFFRHYFL